MTDSFVLEIPEQVGLPVAAKRTAQTGSGDGGRPARGSSRPTATCSSPTSGSTASPST